MAAPVQLFDRALLDARRRRALKRRQADSDVLLRPAVDDLVERLGVVKRRFPVAVDLATPFPLLARRLAASSQTDRVVRLDRLAETLADHRFGVVGDPEALPFAAASLDLVASALAFHFIADLPGMLTQIRHALKPDGLLAANMLGGDTLFELRQCLTTAEVETRGGASPRIAPFAELRQIGALLQRAGFALPVIDQDRLTVRYDDAFGLIRDLRAMGATNALAERERRPIRRAVMFRAAELYARRFADADGRIRATFDVISLSGWAPHESQQQPLRPGSARARLADALGATEQSAGAKAGRNASEDDC